MVSAIINLFLSLFLGFNSSVAIRSEAPVISLKHDARPITVSAERSAVLVANDHYFLYLERADETQPIASITKLMTALVFLDNNPGWDKTYKITANDKVEGGRLNLFLGEEVTVKDLFYTSLVASDNGATLALVHSTGLSEKDFVDLMNKKAKKINLSKTKFVDPAGLNDNNVSTAREVALLAQIALSRPEIREATASQTYQYETTQGEIKKLESTDYLLYDSEANTDSLQVIGGKTGYTEKAGYCFVSQLRDPSGRELISVVLNSSGKNERFKDSRNLANWVFKSYNWNK